MVVLARIDQRLIHGLIVNQWAPALQVKRFMVVDDVLCSNEEVKASMRMANRQVRGCRSFRQRQRSRILKPENMMVKECLSL